MRSPLIAVSVTAISFLFHVSAAPLNPTDELSPKMTLGYDFTTEALVPESAEDKLYVAFFDMLIMGAPPTGNDLVEISKTEDLTKYSSITVLNVSCDVVEHKAQDGISLPIVTCRDKENKNELLMQTIVIPGVPETEQDHRSEQDIVNGSLVIEIYPAPRSDQEIYKAVMCSIIKSWNARERL